MNKRRQERLADLQPGVAMGPGLTLPLRFAAGLYFPDGRQNARPHVGGGCVAGIPEAILHHCSFQIRLGAALTDQNPGGSVNLKVRSHTTI